MDEEQKTKRVKKEGATEDNGEGHKLTKAEEIEQLNVETERLEKAIAEKKNAEARAQISGVVDAGEQPPEKKEETPAEYKDKVLSGNI